MGRLRVHELAKKLNMPNQDLITKLMAKGFLVKTHSSSVDEKAVREALGIANGASGSVKRPRTILRRRTKDIEQVAPIEEVVEEEPVPVVLASEEIEAKPKSSTAQTVQSTDGAVEKEVEKPAKDVMPESPSKTTTEQAQEV